MSPEAGKDVVSDRLAQVGREFGHGFALELFRIREALGRMGEPHLRLPPTIHVAGTNGKGSTCAFLRAIGEAAGHRVHVFTSPHLIRPNERIRLAGHLVDDAAFLAALDVVAATGVTLTYFEALTAAAFHLFAEDPADLLVLEVGLGGRFDATNVIPQPAVTVIAPVDMDHMAFLGDTRAKIAGEKAGILKSGAPAIIARQHPEAMAVIEAAAGEARAPLVRCGIEFDCWRQAGRLIVQTTDRLLDLAPPGLFGPHQYDNAGLAVAAALALHWPSLDEAALSAGVANAQWPARMQRLRKGRLVELAGEAELWLDGAHNPHAAETLAEALAELARAAPRPTHLVIGMLANKDLDGVLAALAPHAEHVTALSIAGHAAWSPDDIAARARALAVEASTAPDLPDAVGQAARAGAGRIVICGSLYLAGTALQLSDGVA